MICLTLPRDLAWITRNRERVKVQYFEEKKNMLQTKLIPLWNRYTYNLILNFLGGGGGFFFLIDMSLIIRYIFFKEIDFVDFFFALKCVLILPLCTIHCYMLLRNL